MTGGIGACSQSMVCVVVTRATMVESRVASLARRDAQRSMLTAVDQDVLAAGQGRLLPMDVGGSTMAGRRVRRCPVCRELQYI